MIVPEQMGEHVKYVFMQKVASPKAFFKAIVEDENGPIREFDKIVAQFARLIREKDLEPLSDSGELEKIIDDVLAANSKNVEEVKAGNTKAMNALVGQAMKATKGKANPAQVNELLKKKLG